MGSSPDKHGRAGAKITADFRVLIASFVVAAVLI